MRNIISYLSQAGQALLAIGSNANSSHEKRSEWFDYAARMIESNVERGQLVPSSESSAFIEQGIFQDALRQAIDSTHNATQAERWRGYLATSIDKLASNLTNSTRNSELPLDRFSVGSSMLLQYNASRNEEIVPAISALQDSIAMQPRNDNGGLWYYNNVANLTAYRGLSYLDGMYSYPLFAVLSAASAEDGKDAASRCDDVYAQFRLLYEHCGQPSGLLSHGYDATKNHSWADPVTGASPIVWGRALAWYTLGLLNVLHSPAIDVCSPAIKIQLRQLLEDVAEPQLTAAQNSQEMAGSCYGVWQVVDRPWKPKNFVESSASFMTTYSLMKANRLGLIPEYRHGRISVTELATGIFYRNYYEYLLPHVNGSLSLTATSKVASLREDVVDYEYYVSAGVENNSLLGTSAFILACLEMAWFEEHY